MVRFKATPAGPTWGPAYEHAKDSYERTTKETGVYPKEQHLYHHYASRPPPRGRRALSVISEGTDRTDRTRRSRHIHHHHPEPVPVPVPALQYQPVYEIPPRHRRPPKYSFWRISTWPCSIRRREKKERKRRDDLREQDRQEFNEALRDARVPVPVPVPVERVRPATPVVHTIYPEPYETPYGTVYPKPVTTTTARPISHQPVHASPAPLYAQPAPVYATPPPVYQQPVYAQPVHQAPQPVYTLPSPPQVQVIQVEAPRPHIITASGQRYEIPENSKVTYRKTFATGVSFAPEPTARSAGVPAVTAVSAPPPAPTVLPAATVYATPTVLPPGTVFAPPTALPPGTVFAAPTMGQPQVTVPATTLAHTQPPSVVQSRKSAAPSARSSRWLHPTVGPARPDLHYPLVETALATMWGNQDSASEGVRQWRDNAALRVEERASRLAKSVQEDYASMKRYTHQDHQRDEKKAKRSKPIPQEVAQNDYKNFRINRQGSVHANKWTKKHGLYAADPGQSTAY